MTSSQNSDNDELDKSIEEWIQTVDNPAHNDTSSRPGNDKTSISPVAESIKRHSIFSQIFGTETKTTSSPDEVIAPADVYPREMSCTQQFDELVKCYSIGGQLRNVYRYGSIRDCNDRWDMFKFCMKVKMDPDEQREKKVYEYYKDRTTKNLLNGSSEDVWTVRRERRKPLFVSNEESDD